jgi:hypothetical protein
MSHFGVASWRAQSVVSGSKVKDWRGLRGHPYNDFNAARKHNSRMHRTVSSERMASVEARKWIVLMMCLEMTGEVENGEK